MSSPKGSINRECHYSTIWQLPGKSHSEGLFLFYLTQIFVTKKTSIPKVLSKIISDNFLTSQLPEEAISVGANKRLTKKNLKKKNLMSEMSIGGSEKFQHALEDAGSQVKVQSFVHSHKRPEKALISHLWLARNI